MVRRNSRGALLLAMAASALSACAASSSHPLDPLGLPGVRTAPDTQGEQIPFTDRDEPQPSFVVEGGAEASGTP